MMTSKQMLEKLEESMKKVEQDLQKEERSTMRDRQKCYALRYADTLLNSLYGAFTYGPRITKEDATSGSKVLESKQE